ncbi:NAD(P)-binding protein [Trichoderma sp. SZMC 28011]
MATIRVGFIGLAAGDGNGLGPGSWGVSALLPTFVLSPHYEIVALCNSSVEAAEKSIKYHKLAPSIEAYGNPEDIANDPDVDLVVVSVHVSKHYELCIPALRAKKQVFCEWPLGINAAQAEEMVKLAERENVKTAVGLQLRADPIIRKVKQLIETGVIGRVTSTIALGCFNYAPIDSWMAEADFYLNYDSGANEYHIAFAHFMDAFTHVLGDFASLQPLLDIQHPTVKTIDSSSGAVVNPARKKTAPDHFFVQGKLETGAIANVAFRKVNKTVDGKGLKWLISGTKGEIELSMDGPMLQMDLEKKHLRLVIGREGKVQDIDYDDPQEPKCIRNVAPPGTNTARLFEDFANKTTAVASFEEAFKVHKLLDKIAEASGFSVKSQTLV